MKKSISLILATLVLLSLCACGSASYDTATTEGYAPAEEYAYDNDYYDYNSGWGYEEEAAEMEMAAAGTGVGTGDSASAASSGNFDTEKIIYTGSANIETTDYEKSCEGVAALISRVGGFLESSISYGSDYWMDGHRTAEYVIRIPRASFESVMANLSDLGNVTYSSVSAENITSSYYDTQSRLSTYRVEEERLLAMLELAENVEDMLYIEDRLADVRYNIESLTTTLQEWDSLVSYSTLSISLEEVIEYTPDPTDEKGYWEQIAEGFMDTLRGIGNFFSGLFKFIIILIPVLVLLALVAFVVVVIVRRSKKRRAAKKAAVNDLPAPKDEKSDGK